MAGDVEGVEAAGVAHLRAEREGLAATAGTEIDHHLAAPGTGHQREQLAAFVLHLDQPFRDDRVLLQRRLAGDADADRRIRCRRRVDRIGAELLEHGIAAGAGDVDAQVQRCRRVDARDPRPEFVAEQRLHAPGEPLGQQVAERFRQRAAVDRSAARQPLDLRRVEGRAQDAFVGLPGEHDEAAIHLALAGAGEMAQQRQLADDGVGGFRQRVPLALPEAAGLAEEVGDDAIGRMLEAEEAVHEFRGGLEQVVRMHRALSLPDRRPPLDPLQPGASQ